MLEEQQTTLGVLSDMAQAAKAQKKTMAVRLGPRGRAVVRLWPPSVFAAPLAALAPAAAGNRTRFGLRPPIAPRCAPQ